MDFEEIKNELTAGGEIITRVFEKWAREIPDNMFIFYGEEDLSLTFREFNEASNRIGHGLQSYGIQKADRISVFLKNPLITAMVMFSIWKAGAVFCPINFNYKGRTLSYQINDTNPKLVITESDVVPLLNEVKDEIKKVPVIVYRPKKTDHDYRPDSETISLDTTYTEVTFEEITAKDKSNLDVDIEYMDNASIIYTSGTTGAPKGVVQSYRWLNNYVFNWKRLFNQEDVIYNDLPLYHVAGSFFNLVRGAWVGCGNALWDRFSSKEFWKRIEKSKATSAVLLDVMVPWLMNAPETP